jgi:magnesium transporter
VLEDKVIGPAKVKFDELVRRGRRRAAVMEQLRLIKIFAAAAVALLGPLLIASIYGMNFKYMPELDYNFGYPLALLLMLLAAVGPYFVWKKMKWL